MVSAILGVGRVANIRLGYMPAELTPIRATRLSVLIAGVQVRSRVRRGSLTVRDALNDAPTTASFLISGTAPIPGESVRIAVDSDDPRLLLSGSVKSVEQTFDELSTLPLFECSVIDDTPQANRRQPFGSWVDIAADVVVKNIISTYAPGFTTYHVQATLPTISLILDGSEGINGALTQIKKLIGGYFYWDDRDLHLFLEESENQPDDIDDTDDRFLAEPPIHLTTDNSQLRTRVFGKGHGETVLAGVNAGETIIPIADGIMFNTNGGHAIAGTIREGAQSQRIAYTGVQLGLGGTLVGPGAAPTAAPTVTPVAGSGVESGEHQWAFTWVTASGETRPSPVRTIRVGPVTAPASAPTRTVSTSYTKASNLAYAAGDAVSYTYTYSEATLSTDYSAESAASPVAGPYTLAALPGSLPLTSLTRSGSNANAVASGPTGLHVGDTALVVNSLDGDWTASTPISFMAAGDEGPAFTYPLNGGATPATPASGTSTVFVDLSAWVNYQQVEIQHTTATTVKNIHVWRVVNGGPSELVLSIPNNFTTGLTLVLDTSRSAVQIPAARGNQAALTTITVGPTGTTSRKIYRTAIGSTQLKLQQTIANNSSTSGVTDATADASLGANAPTSDTSGLTQPIGQLNVGTTSAIVAASADFSADGGWAVVGNGTIAIRYTGLSSNTLTGIPASGNGSVTATVAYSSTITPAPALVGVTGLLLPMLKGASVHIWVQREDLDAQSTQATIDYINGETLADGVYEAPPIVDERRGEESLIALCDATLAQFSSPIRTVSYATRDLKTKSGKPVVFNLTNPPISDTLTLQDVSVNEVDVVDGLAPKFTVTASSIRMTLEDIIRRLSSAALGGQ